MSTESDYPREMEHLPSVTEEIEKLLEVVKVEFPPYRWAAWVRWQLYRLTKTRRKP